MNMQKSPDIHSVISLKTVEGMGARSSSNTFWKGYEVGFHAMKEKVKKTLLHTPRFTFLAPFFE